MQFDFTCTKTTEGLQKLQCMFCNTVFLNASSKPSELQHHFNNQKSEANISSHDVKSFEQKGSALDHEQHL